MSQKRPLKCCHPDCLHCPYKDCRWDTLTTADYSESNRRDYLFYRDRTGMTLHKGADPDYRYQRQLAYNRENRKPVDRHEYNQRYYEQHRQEICDKKRLEYDTEANTKKCRKWYRKHREQRREYEKAYYLRNAEKKRQQAREYYYRKKALADATRGEY